jgi:hypothetical protein
VTKPGREVKAISRGKAIPVWRVSKTGYGVHHDFAFTLAALILIAFSH